MKRVIKGAVLFSVMTVIHQPMVMAQATDCADTERSLVERSRLLFEKVSSLSREYPQLSQLLNDYTMLSFALKEPTCENYKARLSFVESGLAQLKERYESSSSSSALSVIEVSKFNPESEFGRAVANRWDGQVLFFDPAVSASGDRLVVQGYATSSSNKVLCFDSAGKIQWSIAVTDGSRSLVITQSSVALLSSFGKISFYDLKTGQAQKQIQLTDELGQVADQGRRGPFGALSVVDSTGTLAATSNSGRVFFVEASGKSATINIDCAESRSQNGSCYFQSRIHSRKDGVLAVQENGRTLLFRRDGTILKTIPNTWEGRVTVSDDGESFLLVQRQPDPSSRTVSQSILVLKQSGETLSLPKEPISEERAEIKFVSQNQRGDVVFGAGIPSNRYTNESNNAIGLISSGSNEIKLSKVPLRDLLSSNYSKPVSDAAGRILVTNLDGRFFIFDQNGSLQNTQFVGGEIRLSPVVLNDGTIVVMTNGTLHNGPGSIRFFKIP